MKLWLASYPRSGNTYFRVILDTLYSTRSTERSNKHKNILKKILQIRQHSEPVVKTHLLPTQVFPKSKRIPAVYLVRDGRDALVSMAHHKKDIKDPSTEYLENLHDAILAVGDTYFGGWSTHVNKWLARANIVIRYEDLVKDPIESVEKIREVIELPPPNNIHLPTFEEMKFNSSKRISKSVPLGIKKKPDRRKHFFRRGISGAWKDEMPDDLHKLFWELHGDAMVTLGYTEGMP